jgi:signal peptidase II
VPALLEIRTRRGQRQNSSDGLRSLRRGPQSRSVGLSAKWKLVIAWLISIIVLDQLTKMAVDRTMALHGSIPIIDGFFNLTYVRNTGAAFGMFSRSHQAFRLPFLILVSVVAIGFILTMLRRLRDQETGMITALAFILGGALGNLIDRLLHGEVIDFLDVYWSNYHWPAFNLADSFITIGVTITLYYLLKSKGQDPFAAA